MGRPKAIIPAYRRQRHPSDPARDRAFVVIEGRRVYLGTYGNPQSRAEYHRLLAEHSAGVPTKTPRIGSLDDFSVYELIDAYWKYLDQNVTRPENYNSALDLLTDLYGYRPTTKFGSEHLIALQQAMLDKGWRAKYVNKNVARIRRAFKWGVPRKYVPPAVYAELSLVESLPLADDEVDTVHPAPEKDVKAVRRFVSPQVRAMIDLQLLTGARPGELCSLRLIDIDTQKNPWEYRPVRHKTKRRGKSRVIYFGPKAQAILREFMTEDRRMDAPLFSPREAMEEIRRKRHEARTTPLSCGNRPGTNREDNPRWEPGEAYTTGTYAQAIRRACKQAKVDHWTPNQLRHNYATHVRAEHGLDIASTLLGHSKVETTQIYAEKNHERARKVARRIG